MCISPRHACLFKPYGQQTHVYVADMLVVRAKAVLCYLTRLQILLNRTREEYITKQDSWDQMNRLMTRLDGLDAKIDRLIERK